MISLGWAERDTVKNIVMIDIFLIKNILIICKETQKNNIEYITPIWYHTHPKHARLKTKINTCRYGTV